MPKPQITPAGLALFWAGAGLIAIGGFRFDGVLMLLGVLGLAVLGLARFWAPRNLGGIRVTRRLPAHVFAGEPFEITYELSTENNRRLDARGAGVRDDLLPKGPRNELFAVRIPARGGTSTGRIRARLFRRGIERRRRCERISTFPLGLFEVRLEDSFDSPESPDTPGLIVYPRPFLPEKLRRELDLARFEIANPHGLDPEPGGDFRGVRAWRPGDSLRSIHWPATARIGSMAPGSEDGTFSTLMVREWDPPGPRPQRFGILFHSLSPAGNLIRPDRFEMALRIVAGMLLYCREAGIPVRFVSPLSSAHRKKGTPALSTLRMPDRHGFDEGLTLLALTKRVPSRKPAEISGAMKDFGDCERVFVVSDSPANTWNNEIARSGQPVVCIDADSMKVVRPKLKLKLNRRGSR